MDGLSIAASVAGLLQVAAKVVNVISRAAEIREMPSVVRNVLAEAYALQAIFHHLQDFILNFADGNHDDRKSMIYLEHLVATLTGCVCAFDQLEMVLEGLNANLDVSSSLGLWDSAKWALKNQDLGRVLGDLQNHKSSLNLMLSIVTWFVLASV